MSRIKAWAVGGVVLSLGAAASLGCVTHADPPKKTEFAEDAVPKNVAAVEVAFEPARALGYLKQLCDIGPRVSGTEGMKRQQELIEKHFKDRGAVVSRQGFKARQLSRSADTEMINLSISWNPDAARRIAICTHYDTRPIADQEPNRANWNRPFASANDGTSGVAWMMEMGHHAKGLKAAIGIDFILFDGEEYVFETNALGGGDKYFFGSEYFASEYAKAKDTRKFRYEAGILLDLFAGKGAALRVEAYSFGLAPALVEQIWGTAAGIGAKSFKAERGYEVQDDHLALNRVGIPCVDLIDFDYPHWHKLTDTPDKVSGEQMAEVAKVLATWIASIK